MPETVVVGGSEETEVPTAAESAHVASVAEGAVAVQAEQAAEAAAEAQAAAEVALEAAKVNIESGLAVEQAQAAAQESAAVATVSAEMFQQGQQAILQAIDVLSAELKAARESAPKEPAKSGPSGDSEPKRDHGYYRKIGRRK